MQDHYFPEGTSILNVIDHEMGHILDKRNPALRRRVIEVMLKDAENEFLELEPEDITLIAKLNISEYAATETDNELTELISEMLNQASGDNPEYSKKILNQAGGKL